MATYDNFVKLNGPASDCVPTPNLPVPGLVGSLPAGLEELWRRLGLCAYADGLLWIVDPAAFVPCLHEWFGPKKGMVVVARTAFADLFIWRRSGMTLLNPRVGRVARLPGQIELLFDHMLSRRHYVDDLCNREHFDSALPRLGKLSVNECYGYFPALAMGGSGEPQTLKRVGLFEHLSLLRQLTPSLSTKPG